MAVGYLPLFFLDLPFFRCRVVEDDAADVVEVCVVASSSSSSSAAAAAAVSPVAALRRGWERMSFARRLARADCFLRCRSRWLISFSICMEAQPEASNNGSVIRASQNIN